MTVEEAIGANIRRRREWIGITQDQLGQALGEQLGQPWSRQAVSLAEKGGRDFRAVELVALSRVLVTTVGYLTTPSGPVTLPSGETVAPDEAWNRMIGDQVTANLDGVLQSIETLEEAVVIVKASLERAQESLGLADKVIETVRAFGGIAQRLMAADRMEVAE